MSEADRPYWILRASNSLSNSGKKCLRGSDSEAGLEIMLAYFPKKYYFLEQENERKQENTNRKRDDRTAPKWKGVAVTALFSLVKGRTGLRWKPPL
jgi:hypothetical protein